MAATSHSSSDSFPDCTPYTQDEVAMESLFKEAEPSGPRSPVSNIPGPRFIGVPELASQSSFGQGFQFQAKRPNPPGQFTGRPLQPVVPAIQPMRKSDDSHNTPRGGGQVLGQQPSTGPLLLPELAFTPSAPDNHIISSHFRDPRVDKRQSPQASHQSQAERSPTSPAISSGDFLDDIIIPESNVNKACSGKSDQRGTACHPSTNVVQESQFSLMPRSKGTRSSSVVRSSSPLPYAETREGVTPPTARDSHQNPTSRSTGHSAVRDIPIRVAPHILRAEEACRSSSPVSVCGDLEPLRRTRNVRASKSPRGLSRPFPEDHSPRLCRPEDQFRSQSRTSNVSKKRSGVSKPVQRARSQRCPDRRSMMQEMASQWNEYLLAADRDKDEYRLEVESLQHDMNIQAAELAKANKLLSQKNQRLELMEERCGTLQKQHETVLADKDELDEQVRSLREEIQTTSKQTQAARERNSACRKKVNEAIGEHQKLFRLTKSYCSDLQDQLTSEQKERAVHSDEVRRALEKSTVQRKAMKDFASFVKNEVQAREVLKDEVIAALRSRVSEQHQTLSRVQFLEKSLQTQLKSQQATQSSVSDLHGALTAFVRAYDRDSEARAIAAASVDTISNKIEILAERVEASASGALTKNEATSYATSLKESMAASFERVIDALAVRESNAERKLTSVEHSLRASIKSLEEELREHDKNMEDSSTLAPSLHDDICARFDRLEAEMRRSQAITEQVEEQVSSLVRKGETDATLATCKLSEANEKLEKRGLKINELKRQLQLVTEDYQAKIAAKREEAQAKEANRQHIGQQQIQQIDEMTKAFEAQLDFALAQQRDECEIAMREEQTEHWTAENSLRETRAKLQALTDGTDKTQQLEEQLTSQETLISQLRARIETHELQAEAHRELSRRWQQDVEAVDRIRSQIRSIESQVSDVELLGQGFERFMRVHDVLNSTAEYLTEEQGWVQAQLLATQPAAGIGRGTQNDRHERPSTIETSSRATSSDSQILGASLAQDWERRRVVVQSPSGSVGSPSPPPSIEQERKRRRAGFETQSILRVSAISDMTGSAASLEIKSEAPKQPSRGLFDLMKGHSRYFRPITSTSPAILPTANSGIVEQIRAGLTQSQDLSWSLPTLADFEQPERRLGNSMLADNSMGIAVAGPPSKRLKLES